MLTESAKRVIIFIIIVLLIGSAIRYFYLVYTPKRGVKVVAKHSVTYFLKLRKKRPTCCKKYSRLSENQRKRITLLFKK